MRRCIGAAIGMGFVCAAPLLSAQDKVEQGSALVTSQKCVMCHSIGAKGNKKGPLDEVGNKLKAEDIRAWLTTPDAMREKTQATRTPVMKDPKLGKDQIDALVAFLLTQKTPAAK